MIETWAFYFFTTGNDSLENPPTIQEYQALYDRYMDLWVACDGLGFDGLAFAEHHFNPVSLSPSTHLLIAAVAARTQNLRFTTLGSVLPLHDARRYVEEVGMLDYLTHGRFEPGIAPGAGDAEAVAAGLPPAEIRPRYRSGAELLVKAAADPRVTHKDDYYDLDDVMIVPPLLPGPRRAPWATVMSPGSAQWAAENGFRLCTAWLPEAAAAGLAAHYRAAAQAAGREVDPSMLGIRRRVFVAPSDAEAREKYEASVDVVAATVGKAFETTAPGVPSMMMHPDDFAIGSPETVAEKLIEQCRSGGYGALMAFTDFALFTQEDLRRSHELIGEKVAPALRSAKVGVPDSAPAAS